MKAKTIIVLFALLLTAVLVAPTVAGQVTNEAASDAGAEQAAQAGTLGIAVALAIGLTGIATAWAEKEIGTAAMGAVAENPKLFTNGLIYMVLPETIVVFGFVIGFLINGKIPTP